MENKITNMLKEKSVQPNIEVAPGMDELIKKNYEFLESFTQIVSKCRGLENDVKEAVDVGKTYQRENQELRTQKSYLEKDLVNVEKRLGETYRELCNTQEREATLRKQYEETLALLRESKTNFNQKTEYLEKRLKRYLKYRRHIQQVVPLLIEKNIQKIQYERMRELDAAKKKNDLALDEIIRLRTQLKEVGLQKHHLEKERTALADTYQSLTHNFNLIKQQTDNQTLELRKLKNQLTEAKKELENAITTKAICIEKSRKREDELQSNVENLENDKLFYKHENAKKEQKIIEITTDNEKKNSQIQELLLIRDSYKNNLKQKDEHLAVFTKENQRLDTELQHKTFRIRQLTKENSVVKMHFRERNNQANGLAQQNEILQKKLESLQLDYATVRRQLDDLLKLSSDSIKPPQVTSNTLNNGSIKPPQVMSNTTNRGSIKPPQVPNNPLSTTNQITHPERTQQDSSQDAAADKRFDFLNEIPSFDFNSKLLDKIKKATNALKQNVSIIEDKELNESDEDDTIQMRQLKKIDFVEN